MHVPCACYLGCLTISLDFLFPPHLLRLSDYVLFYSFRVFFYFCLCFFNVVYEVFWWQIDVCVKRNYAKLSPAPHRTSVLIGTWNSIKCCHHVIKNKLFKIHEFVVIQALISLGPLTPPSQPALTCARTLESKASQVFLSVHS